MHVYLRSEPIRLRMRSAEAQGIVPDDSDLVPMAFFVVGNEHPSFRALLPPDTLEVLREALEDPVTLGLLAEEPESPDSEIQAMVGLAVPVDSLRDAVQTEEDSEPEPWKESVGDPEAWRGDSHDGGSERDLPHTALLAFAPLVRVQRKFPNDFGDELADLLESALSGATRSALEARVDRLLGDL